MLGKRQFRRKVKKEKNRMQALLSVPQPNFANSVQAYNQPFLLDNDDLPSTSGTLHNEGSSIKKKLKDWFLSYKPNVKCATSLLRILKSEDLDVPTSVVGLLGKYEKCKERTVAPGKYIHIGLKTHLEKLSTEILKSDTDEITLDIGIDGLPIFKSSEVSLWPILGQVKNIRNSDVFIIGSYIGPKKPININVFLHDFVTEMSDIIKNGFYINSKRIAVNIRAFICDAPAKAFVCGIRGHVSSNGCTKCQQIAQKVDNTLTYSLNIGEKRSDEDFSLRRYENFHQPLHQEVEMELERLGIGMITQFPLESMHLIDLGITKKILTAIAKKKTINPVSSSNIISISEVLLSLKPFIPREFARKPRTLLELPRWKATEFREFSLYTGIVALKEHVPEEIYEHFLLLHCFYRILSSSPNTENLRKAQLMTTNFVELFPVLYGRSSISYNVHNILHIAECVEQFGDLSNFSAYNFENFLQKIKKNIKMPKHIGQQIFNNFSNQPIVLPNKFIGLKYKKNDIKSISLEKGFFTNECPNNICILDCGKYVEITKILNGETFMGKCFKNPDNFFVYPINSLDINIAFVEENYFDEEIYSFEVVMSKIVKLPFNHGFVLIPEIHSF